MTGYVYTIAGGKGGVGKTTTAINVAVALEDAGHDVVVVDADLGMANLGAMLDIEHQPSLHQVLAGKAAVSDAITEGPGGITVVPGERNLEAFADADPAKLRKVVKALSTAYEIVLIDTGAGLSHETTVPLGLADGVLLITTANDVAIGDTVKTAQLADRIEGDVVGAVLTRANDDTNVSEVADKLDLEMLAVVPEDQDATQKEPLLINDPDSYAAEAYRRLASTMEEIYEANTEGGVEPEQEFEPASADSGDSEDGEADDEPETPIGAGADADDTAAESESTDDGDDGDDEDEDEDGVFGLFN
ncbi:MinD/ParA family ATP-binding protein [Halorientalis marina]|uniref:MinD/ParA family ATP-binding protein n=1 Tax=Halorientalis marina TaxID=2931976 RepID=UPI001FF4D4C7|nr:AAA family ATPase [Halorientalis marina]